MQALTYNCDLEISASVRAKTCQSVINETLSVGENSFIVDPKTDSNLLIDTALFAWWDQISNTKDNEYSHSKNISSFSNMAWATTIYVGCSVGQCEDRKLFVCHYHPKGNIPREKIYFEGKACKTNLHCLSINQGSCYNSLCTADDYPLSREGLNFDGRPFSSQPISSNIPTFQALLHQLTKSEADNTTTAFPEWESTSPQP
uniref:SCP domain-containing protein n=1 Tax=Rhabditophanes sp. KR3021 TaxID=114890 RepID=A0AC35TSR3_9BILA